MSEPKTDAGRLLLAVIHGMDPQGLYPPDPDEMILAIEAEARRAALVEHRCDALAAGKVSGAADLARRIEARVEGIHVEHLGHGQYIWRAAVLAAIREEATK